MRQVTHALLTRPPLSHKWFTRRIIKSASLDLHVLSTPPAFILSQDQIFAWLNIIPFYLLWFCSLRTKFFWTFKDMSLFSYQGSWFVAFSAATSLLYQTLFCLSRTFLTFSKVFFDVLFSNLLSEYWFYHWFSLLSRTFLFFWIFYFIQAIQKNTEKEGFEPSHRANGLHP